MPKPRKRCKTKAKPKVCVACGGTGRNSKGHDCVPCLLRRREAK